MKPSEAAKWVYQHLNVATVRAIVGDKIFPYTTQEQQNLPWVVYDDVTIDYLSSKDANKDDVMTATVICASGTLDETLPDVVFSALNNVDDCIVKHVRQYYDDQVGYMTELEISLDL